MGSPFLPGDGSAPDVAPQPQQTQEDQMALKGRWDDWLRNDANRSALLQMGLQLMQPVGLGQTPLGAVGQAIGAGGEAAGRVSAAEAAAAKEQFSQGQQERKTQATESNAEASMFRATHPKANSGAGAADRKKAQDRKAFQTWLKAQFPTDFDGTEQAKAMADPKMVRELVTRFQKEQSVADQASGNADPNGDFSTPRQAPDQNWYIRKGGKYYKVPEPVTQ